jgi:hypothetical protein
VVPAHLVSCSTGVHAAPASGLVFGSIYKQPSAAQTIANTFIGPPLAGFLAGLGFAVATGSSTLMYAAAGLALILMRGMFGVSSQETTRADRRWWGHLTEGLRFLWRDRLIRNLTLFTASMNLFWSGWGLLLCFTRSVLVQWD